jgi:hypothetical protein
MAKQNITCPSCNSRYQTAAAAGRQLPCPRCGAVLVVPAQATVPSDLLDSLESSDVSTASPAALGAGLGQQGLRASNLAKQRRPRAKAGLSVDPQLKPFLKRLGLGVGIICSLIVLTGTVGWFSEPIGMGAVILGIVAMVGLALAGRIWFVVIAFQESVGLGVALIFVPLLWLYLLAKRIGRSQLAFALLVSSLMPALVTLGVTGLLATRHSTAGRSAARATNLAKKADQFAETIHQYESKNPPTDEPREAIYSYAIKIDDPSKFVAEGDRLLSQFAGYVKGSLTVDQEQRTISFQHRGTNELESRYRVYLSSKTSVPIRPKSK